MGNTPPDGLGIAEDLDFQNRMWAVQRAGWLLLGVFLVAAAGGALGSGPLSQQVVRKGPVQIEYQRVIRTGSPANLRISTTHPGLAIRFPSDFLELIRIDDTVSILDGVRKDDGDGLFIIRPGSQIAVMEYSPRSFGHIRTNVIVNDETIPLNLLVLP